MKKITKAVIPAAGLGTRVLPASKSVPKEMLNIVDKPAIQYIVEEAAAAGITDILIITNRGKGAIEDHFDHSFELEKNLEGNAAKRDLYESVLACSDIADIYLNVRRRLRALRTLYIAPRALSATSRLRFSTVMMLSTQSIPLQNSLPTFTKSSVTAL